MKHLQKVELGYYCLVVKTYLHDRVLYFIFVFTLSSKAAECSLPEIIMTSKASVYQGNYQSRHDQKIRPLAYAWYQWVFPPLYLMLVTLAAYIPSLHYSFQFDDYYNIYKCFSIRHNTLKDLFFTGPRWVSSWLNTLYYKINKFEPFVYRLANVLVHLASSILLFYALFVALRRLDKQPFIQQYAWLISFSTALLFALHPVQTQTVSYVIQGQLEGLAGFSIIALVLTFLLYCSSRSPVAKTIGMISLFLIGIFSCGTKEIAIVSPALLFLVDWFFVAQGSRKAIASRMLFHCIFSAVIIGIYVYFLKPAFFKDLLGLKLVARNNIGNVITQHPSESIAPLHFLISQFKVIVHYVWIFFWPFSISADYDWKLVTSFFSLDCLAPLVIVLNLAVVIFRRLQKCSFDVISFGAFWFLIVILPRSSIMPSSELLADYKTYLASIGIFFMLSVGLAFLVNYVELLKKNSAYAFGQINFYSMLLIFSSLLGYATYTRNQVWSSNEAFWFNVRQHAPKRARAHNNYAAALAQRGEFQAAIPYYEQAIELDSNYPDPYNNLAVCYYGLNDFDKAISYAHKSLALNPHQPEVYLNMSNALLEKQEYAQALECIEKALQLRPNYGKAYVNKGRLLRENHRYQESYQAFKTACMQADLDNAFGFSMFGDSCMILEKYDEAISAYKQSLTCNPKEYLTAFNLANSYFLSNQFEPALLVYQELTKVSKDIKLLLNLSDTYAKLKQYKEAFAVLQGLEEEHQSMPEVILAKAGCLERLGLPDQAKKILETFLVSNPKTYYKFAAERALKNLGRLRDTMNHK